MQFSIEKKEYIYSKKNILSFYLFLISKKEFNQKGKPSQTSNPSQWQTRGTYTQKHIQNILCSIWQTNSQNRRPVYSSSAEHRAWGLAFGSRVKHSLFSFHFRIIWGKIGIYWLKTYTYISNRLIHSIYTKLIDFIYI